MQDMAWIGLALVLLQLLPASCSEAAFSVSLELQGGNCSDQLTLICRHSDDGTAPQWIHNGTLESGVVLATAFPGAEYTVLNRTEHTTTITGVASVRALDGYLIQCAYEILGDLIKSNAVKFTFIPPDYQPALTFETSAHVKLTSKYTCIYSFNESCSLYPRCTPYFSVEHTVSPPSAVSNSSSGCIVSYTILNLMRCVSYQSTATALLGNQRGNTVVQGVTVMLGPGRFTITSVSIGADRNLINVTYIENEPDCPGYPTERYTVDVDGVQVADLTADKFQSLVINHTNGSVTLFLPVLNQPLPENAVTLSMTKHNTVPTNRSDVKGNMEDMETYAWFDLPGKKPTTPDPDPGSIRVIDVNVHTGTWYIVLSAVVVLVVGVLIAVIIVILVWRIRKWKKEKQP